MEISTAAFGHYGEEDIRKHNITLDYNHKSKLYDSFHDLLVSSFIILLRLENCKLSGKTLTIQTAASGGQHASRQKGPTALYSNCQSRDDDVG